MKGLTTRQREVLDYIARSISETGYPPTIREIGVALSIRSTNGVNDHLKALARKGYIERDTSKSRAILLTGLAEDALGLDENPAPGVVTRDASSTETVEVPVYGRIAAGVPIEAASATEDPVHVDVSLLGGGRGGVYALRVQGDSMIGDGIFDGDLIFVRPEVEARRGQMVAVRIEEGATVKRYYREGDIVRLEPSNPEMEPIIVRADQARDAMILGRVVGVYRSLD